MSRTYLVFGSDDGVNWEQLKPVFVGGAQQALNRAMEQERHRYYAAVPERHWKAAMPEVVQRPPVVKWGNLASGQMTVHDVLDEKDE